MGGDIRIQPAGHQKQSTTKQSGIQGSNTYSVKPGDSLSLIAQRYGVTVRDILAWNTGLKENTVLKPGMNLAVVNKKAYLYSYLRGYAIDQESMSDTFWQETLDSLAKTFPTDKGQRYPLSKETIAAQLKTYNSLVKQHEAIEQERTQLWYQFHQAHRNMDPASAQYKKEQEAVLKKDAALTKKQGTIKDPYKLPIAHLLDALMTSGIAFQCVKEDPALPAHFSPEKDYEILYDPTKYKALSSVEPKDMRLVEQAQLWSTDNVMKMIDAITGGDRIIGPKAIKLLSDKIEKRIGVFTGHQAR